MVMSYEGSEIMGKNKNFSIIIVAIMAILVFSASLLVYADENKLQNTCSEISFQQMMPLEKIEEGVYTINSVNEHLKEVFLYDDNNKEGILKADSYTDSKNYRWILKYIKNTGPEGNNEWDKYKTEYLYEIYNEATGRKLTSENIGGNLDLILKENYEKEHTFGFGTGKNPEVGIKTKDGNYYIVDGMQRNSALKIEENMVKNLKNINLNKMQCQFKLNKLNDDIDETSYKYKITGKVFELPIKDNIIYRPGLYDENKFLSIFKNNNISKNEFISINKEKIKTDYSIKSLDNREFKYKIDKTTGQFQMYTNEEKLEIEVVYGELESVKGYVTLEKDTKIKDVLVFMQNKLKNEKLLNIKGNGWEKKKEKINGSNIPKGVYYSNNLINMIDNKNISSIAWKLRLDKDDLEVRFNNIKATKLKNDNMMFGAENIQSGFVKVEAIYKKNKIIDYIYLDSNEKLNENIEILFDNIRDNVENEKSDLNIEIFKCDKNCKEGIFKNEQSCKEQILDGQISLSKDGKNINLNRYGNNFNIEDLDKGEYKIIVDIKGYNRLVGKINLSNSTEKYYVYLKEIDKYLPNAEIILKYYGDGTVDAILTNYSKPVYVIGGEVVFKDGEINKFDVDSKKTHLVDDDKTAWYKGIKKNGYIHFLIIDENDNEAWIKKEIIVGTDSNITDGKQDR